MIKADHKVLSESWESRNNHRYEIVVEDLATQRLHCVAIGSRPFWLKGVVLVWFQYFLWLRHRS